eukprot:scaffold3073_cov66-Cylindrotheca_fusiformis.AAC.6
MVTGITLATPIGALHLSKVTDDVDIDDPWTVEGLLDVDDEAPMLFVPEAGVPNIACSFLMEEGRYVMKNDTALTFTDIPGYPCTEFGKIIMYFFIFEWKGTEPHCCF